MGAARKMELVVPKMTPRIMANENDRMLSPPNRKMQMSTKRVVKEVINVRQSVLLSDSLKRVKTSR